MRSRTRERAPRRWRPPPRRRVRSDGCVRGRERHDGGDGRVGRVVAHHHGLADGGGGGGPDRDSREVGVAGEAVGREVALRRELDDLTDDLVATQGRRPDQRVAEHVREGDQGGDAGESHGGCDPPTWRLGRGVRGRQTVERPRERLPPRPFAEDDRRRSSVDVVGERTVGIPGRIAFHRRIASLQPAVTHQFRRAAGGQPPLLVTVERVGLPTLRGCVHGTDVAAA